MTNTPTNHKAHAVALFSGGLDSALAILLMLRQNIKVTALTFMTHFGCDLGDRSSCGSNPYPAAEKFGFDVKLMHLGQKFVDIVEKPKYGYGKNMNVCIDCRLLMLSEAKAYMEMVDADIVITGEVVGQRPFSQRKDAMNMIIREAGLKGKLLRPLSAKILPPIEAELNGLVDRDLLEGISGRSRKRQMELAEEFGLEDYPSPASGCLLTNEGYSNRLRDLVQHTPKLTFNDLNLLRLGRHFRLDFDTKAIVGRNENENNAIENYAQEGHYLLEAPDLGSPMTLVVGSTTDENLMKASMITGRYCSGKYDGKVRVIATPCAGGELKEFRVDPAQDEDLQHVMIK